MRFQFWKRSRTQSAPERARHTIAQASIEGVRSCIQESTPFWNMTPNGAPSPSRPRYTRPSTLPNTAQPVSTGILWIGSLFPSGVCGIRGPEHLRNEPVLPVRALGAARRHLSAAGRGDDDGDVFGNRHRFGMPQIHRLRQRRRSRPIGPHRKVHRTDDGDPGGRDILSVYPARSANRC